MLRLSVLDQSTIVTGRPPAASIRESLALARHAEALGYTRYWVAEHHNSAAIAGTAPEVLLAALAVTTSRIRLGSAGVMLPHYSALKVAEQFRVLEALAPGRIDLGLGRAPGSDGRTAFALNPLAETAAGEFPAQIRDLAAWVSGAPLVAGHPFHDIVAHPQGPTAPELWMLGSSTYGAQVAGYFGMPFCFAHFITDGHGTEEALAAYRAAFRPSARWPAPHAALCVWALAAATEAEADHLFASRAAWRLNRDRGVYTALPAPEAALAAPLTEGERTRIARLRAGALAGTAPEVGQRLRALAAAHDVTEIAVLTTVHDAAARRRSYTLLAAEFGLAGAVPAAA